MMMSHNLFLLWSQLQYEVRKMSELCLQFVRFSGDKNKAAELTGQRWLGFFTNTATFLSSSLKFAAFCFYLITYSLIIITTRRFGTANKANHVRVMLYVTQETMHGGNVRFLVMHGSDSSYSWYKSHYWVLNTNKGSKEWDDIHKEH